MLIIKEVDSMEAMVNVAELIYQLQYGAVILERLPDTGQISRTAEANAPEIDDNSKKNDEFFFKDPGKKLSSSTSKPYCSNCDKTIENSSLDNVKRCPDCRKKLRYKCMMCNSRFSSHRILKYHLHTKCNPKGVYECSKCNYSTTIKQSMSRHATMHSIDEATGTRKCLGCDERFLHFIDLKSHLKVCSKALNFKPLNGKTLSRKVKDNVPILVNADSIRKCSGCGKEFQHTANLKNHQKVCNEALNYKRLDTKDSNPNADDNVTTLVKATGRNLFSRHCSNCDIAIGVKSMVNKAKCQKCGSLDTFQCNKCNKMFCKYKLIKHHLTTVCFPAKRYYNCKKCNKTFQHAVSVKKHLLYCGKEANLFCRFCKYSTKYKQNLRKHLKIHENCTDPVVRTINNINDNVANTKSKKFKTVQSEPDLNTDCLDSIKRYCSKCVERTDVNSDKRKSCQKCKTLLLLECVICKKIYERLHKIIYHVKNTHSVKTEKNVHSRRKNHTVSNCSQCGRFVRIGCMENHLQFCGKKSNFQCKHCAYKTSSISKLKFHLWKTHFMSKKTIITKTRAKRTSSGRLDWLTSTKRYCPKCDQYFKIKKKSKVEICQKCNTTLIYQCSRCHGRYDNYAKIFYHLKTFCYPPSLYRCTKCDYTTFKKSEVLTHMKNVHELEIIACFKCGKKFKEKKYLKAHEESCGIKPHLFCKYCPFKTNARRYLNIHLKRHLDSITSSEKESGNIIAKKRKR